MKPLFLITVRNSSAAHFRLKWAALFNSLQSSLGYCQGTGSRRLIRLISFRPRTCHLSSAALWGIAHSVHTYDRGHWNYAAQGRCFSIPKPILIPLNQYDAQVRSSLSLRLLILMYFCKHLNFIWLGIQETWDRAVTISYFREKFLRFFFRIS